ncbi:hypothetical protein BJV82DRAFT_694781 [Fennellomyces sp. T-0311]|nr:hypothetical protein BJV82DRAFT_694781 [Fennellomyces sp. T-0311]
MKATLSALIFAVFAALMVAAQHQPYYLINPVPGEPVEAGKEIRVQWLNGKDEEVTVYLIEGSGRENMLPTGYSVKANGADGGVDFTIPADSDTKGRYGLRIDYVSDKGRNAQAFSAAFQVTSGTPAEDKEETTTTTTTAPAATKTEETKSSESSPAAKDDKEDDKQDEKKDDDKKDDDKDAEKDADKKDDDAKETSAATTTPEAQEEDEDEENSAVSVKFAAIMMAVPAIVAGAFLA